MSHSIYFAVFCVLFTKFWGIDALEQQESEVKNLPQPNFCEICVSNDRIFYIARNHTFFCAEKLHMIQAPFYIGEYKATTACRRATRQIRKQGQGFWRAQYFAPEYNSTTFEILEPTPTTHTEIEVYPTLSPTILIKIMRGHSMTTDDDDDEQLETTPTTPIPQDGDGDGNEKEVAETITTTTTTTIAPASYAQGLYRNFMGAAYESFCKSYFFAVHHGNVETKTGMSLRRWNAISPLHRLILDFECDFDEILKAESLVTDFIPEDAEKFDPSAAKAFCESFEFGSLLMKTDWTIQSWMLHHPSNDYEKFPCKYAEDKIKAYNRFNPVTNALRKFLGPYV